MARKLIGHIGVDSGQIMIVDPCYLKDWKDNEFNYRTGIRNLKTGVEICCWDEVEGIEGKINWATPLPQYGGKDLNELAKDTENWEKFDEYPDAGEFSYSGASGITCKQMFGELDLAVVSRTQYGDGSYPVYAELDREGRPKRIIIDFEYEEEDFEEDEF